MKRSLTPEPLVFPTPVWVVGTYDREGKANVMTAAWGGICCSKPPCVAVALRKATYTYSALVQRKAFTISVPTEQYLKQVDYIGIATGAAVDKFSETGLTAVRSELVDAPYVGEFPFILECNVVAIHELGLHTQFVGEILGIQAEEAVCNERGPDISKIRPLIFDPRNWSYFSIGPEVGKAFESGNEI